MWYQWAIVVAAFTAFALAYNIPRSGLWLASLAASFIVSGFWWDLGGPMPAAFGAATDFIIALIMLQRARKQWEFYALDCFCFMILVDVCWQFGAISSHYWYAISLEAANWAIILLIGAVGIADRLHANGEYRRRSDHGLGLGLLSTHLGRKTKYPRWWRRAE